MRASSLFLARALGGAVLFFATATAPAQAAITFTYQASGTGDPGQPGSNVVLLDDFGSTRLLPESSYYFSGGARVNCASVTGTTAACNSAVGQPPIVTGAPNTGMPKGFTGSYVAITPTADGAGGQVGLFNLGLAGQGLNNISFYAGSIDQRNVITLLNSSGSLVYRLTGTDLGAPGYYSPLPGGRVTLSWDAATDDVATLELLDYDVPAFELTNVTSNIGAVPEPASWGLMIVGMLAVGAGLRRRPARRLAHS